MSSEVSKLDSITFDKFLRQQEPLRAPAPIFDLRGVTLITPAVLVQLAASCHALAREGRQATITTDNESVRTYLMRSGFFKVIRDVTKVEPEVTGFSSLRFEFMRGSNPMLIEVTRIENGAALPTLLDQ